MGAPESRDEQKGLLGLLGAVWSSPTGELPQVATGAAAARATGADHFLCLPSPRRARLLVPAGETGNARSVIAANLALRPLRQRAQRRFLSVVLGTGLPRQLLRGCRLSVAVAEPATLTLMAALRQEWRGDVVGIGLSVREVTPNYKPSLVAVDAAGTVLGYAKIGWNDGTRARLEVERAALERLSDMESPGLLAPEIEADFSWNGRRILVVRPLPSSARAYPRRSAAPLALVTTSLADPAGRSVEAATLAQNLSAAIDRVKNGSLADAAGSFGERFAARHRGCTLPGGLRHGDWVPWNLGTAQGRLWAWDWEYADDQSTPMLDVAHWHLQIARFVENHTIPVAFARLEERLSTNLAAIGIGGETVAVLRDLAVLDLAERSAALAADTGIWRPGMLEQLLTLLRQ